MSFATSYFAISEIMLTSSISQGIVSPFEKQIEIVAEYTVNSCYSETMSRTLRANAPPSDPQATSLAALGHLIRAQRVASGLRIDDAAALSGVSVDLMSRLENGRSGVSTDRLLKILDALGLVMLLLEKAQLPKTRSALAGPEEPAAR